MIIASDMAALRAGVGEDVNEGFKKFQHRIKNRIKGSTKKERVDLGDLHCLVDDNEAFLAEVTKRVTGIHDLVVKHIERSGIDPETRDFYPEAEAALRRAFAVIDANASGTVSWEEIKKGVQDGEASDDAEPVNMIALSNTFRMIDSGNSTTNGELDVDSFVDALRRKARHKLGTCSNASHTIYRYMTKIDSYLALTSHNSVDNSAAHERYTDLLQSRNIDSHLVEKDGVSEGVSEMLGESAFGRFTASGVGDLMNFANGLDIPTLGAYTA